MSHVLGLNVLSLLQSRTPTLNALLARLVDSSPLYQDFMSQESSQASTQRQTSQPRSGYLPSNRAAVSQYLHRQAWLRQA